MNLRPYLFLVSLFLVFNACKKQDGNVFLSNEGTQGFDGYSYTDTFRLLTCTVREDSLKSDSLSHNLLGIISDPVFGKYSASSFFQFKLPQLNKVISTEQLDSAVLYIQFTSKTAYYGDLASQMAFSVHELSESMTASVTHSDKTYQYNAASAGNFTGKFNPSDSMVIRNLGKTVKGAPGMSVKLSAALAQKLFDASASNLSSQENFLTYFKGLALVPAADPLSGTGVIAAINMQGSSSFIRVFYNDTLQSDFKVFDNARRFTHYNIGNQGNGINMQKSAGTKASFDTTYVQAMSGAKTRIKIPYLFGLARNNGKKISVGKAEIIIRPLAGTYASPFALPTRLLLLQPNADNNLNAGIIDLLEPFYGGNYNAVSNEYRFNVTRHIQSLFSDYQNKGIDNNRGFFLITPSDFPIAPSRMVADMRKGIPGSGIEFKLIYTEL